MSIALVTPIRHTYFALAILFVILTVFVTGVRFYARHLKRATLALDDWLALAALVFYLAEIGVHLWSMLAGGVGLHQVHVTPAQLETSFKSLTIVEYPYTAALTCIRISIALLMKRIFIQRWFRLCTYGIIFLNIAWLLFIYFDAALICRPIAYNWDQSIPGGYCGDKDQSFVVMAVWGIFIDTLTWTLPLFVIWSLNTTSVKKAELSALFCLGLFDIGVSIVRIVQLENLNIEGDFSFTLAPVEIWSFIEAGVAIIIANLPTCRHAVLHLFHSNRPRESTQYGYSNGSANARPPRGSKQLVDDELQLWPPGRGFSTFQAGSGLPELVEEGASASSSDGIMRTSKAGNIVNVHKEVWVSQSRVEQSREDLG